MSRDRWENGARLTAGLVPLVNGEVVLVSNRKNSGKWGLPKGGWEDWEEKVSDAASREAFEEAGVRGIIGATLSPTQVRSKNGGHLVRTEWFVSYITEVLGDWPEREQRLRCIVSIEKAISLVHRSEQRQILEEVGVLLFECSHFVSIITLPQVRDRRLSSVRVQCTNHHRLRQLIPPRLGISVAVITCACLLTLLIRRV
jgi:ADP-ribose pyrophosphatase YjhB (NUDIX family)